MRCQLRRPPAQLANAADVQRLADVVHRAFGQRPSRSLQAHLGSHHDCMEIRLQFSEALHQINPIVGAQVHVHQRQVYAMAVKVSLGVRGAQERITLVPLGSQAPPEETYRYPGRHRQPVL